MKVLTKDDVERLAKLSHLRLSEQEVEKFTPQLEESLEYVGNLKEVDTANIPDTAHMTTAYNVMQDDVVDETVMLSSRQALSQSKNTRKGYFVVKRIL